MLLRMWNEGKTPTLLVEEKTYKATLEINLVVSQEIGNGSTSRSTYNKTLGPTTKGHFLF